MVLASKLQKLYAFECLLTYGSAASGMTHRKLMSHASGKIL